MNTSSNRRRVRKNLRNQLILLTSPTAGLSPIKEEGTNNCLDLQENAATPIINNYLTSSQCLSEPSSAREQDDSGVFEDFDDVQEGDDMVVDDYIRPQKHRKMSMPTTDELVVKGDMIQVLEPTNCFSSPVKVIRTLRSQSACESPRKRSMQQNAGALKRTTTSLSISGVAIGPSAAAGPKNNLSPRSTRRIAAVDRQSRLQSPKQSIKRALFVDESESDESDPDADVLHDISPLVSSMQL